MPWALVFCREVMCEEEGDQGDSGAWETQIVALERCPLGLLRNRHNHEAPHGPPLDTKPHQLTLHNQPMTSPSKPLPPQFVSWSDLPCFSESDGTTREYMMAVMEGDDHPGVHDGGDGGGRPPGRGSPGLTRSRWCSVWPWWVCLCVCGSPPIDGGNGETSEQC